MAIPCGPAPPDGWPILLWMNGTGGSARATPISQLGPNLPYAVLSIAPLYSGDRLVAAPAPFNTPEFQFFNYVNPLAARTNLLQQAADMLYLKRVAQNLTLAPGEAGGGVDHLRRRHRRDGRPQPGVVPACRSRSPSTPPSEGAFLSAGGAGLYHSIVHRGDVRALVDGLLGAAPGELDMLPPVPADPPDLRRGRRRRQLRVGHPDRRRALRRPPRRLHRPSR